MRKVTKVKKTRDGRYEAWWLYRGHWVRLGWYWERKDANAALDAQMNSIRALAG